MNLRIEAEDRHCLRPGEADSLLRGAPWRRLVVLGDSIAVHPGDPVDGYLNRTWAARLADALDPAAYLNLGVAGARVAEVRAGQLDAALEFRPDLAVVVAGANDALRPSFAPPVVEAELDRLLGPLGRGGALLVTFGCFSVGRAAVDERLRALGSITARVCRRNGGVHLDFADHPAQSGGVLSADHLHINVRGHALVGADVIRALARRITPSTTRSKGPA